ncbi:MAG: TonB-dependent receptor [Pseudomonadota bacterium]
MSKTFLSALGCLLAATAHAQNDTADDADPSTDASVLPVITIIGDSDDLLRLPGAATTIAVDEILAFNQSDIQRMLRSVPGVSVQIEDGYGLRPNISIRGTASERSARVTLLEDGILIAPAPYSAPAAYYFPTAGRLAGIEVLKGPAAITEGPYTIGGAINLISTPIPDSAGGLLNVQLGEDTTWRVHANYGASEGPIGWLLETHQWRSDGFQDLDGGDDTGLEKEDYLAKFRYRFGTNDNQQIEAKLHYATESSDQSYLGLTDADFAAAPFRRYGLSTLDNIDTEHAQVLLRHSLQRNDLEVTTSVYYNEFERDWFKTEGFDVTGSPDAETFNGVSWFQVIQAINRGLSLGPAEPTDLAAILDGADTQTGAIQIRSNAREYYSAGVEFDVRWQAELGRSVHRLAAGLRIHTDHEERLQRNSTYTQTGGGLVLADLGLLGNAGNSEQDADVWAFWIRDEIEFGRWLLSPGVRFESIDQERTLWESRPGFTTNPASRDAANLRERRGNDTDVVIPGLGVVYALSDTWSAYGGIHRGFSAPSNAPGADEEESINYEAGIRYLSTATRIDAGVFLTDYDNLVGTCTASSGIDCEVGDAFNGDAATVAGLELSVQHTFRTNGELRFPVSLALTVIDAEFDSDIADTDFFGDVTAGDPLPYIPDTQGLLSVGAETDRWSALLSVNFVDATCVRASCESFEATEAFSQIDMAGRYLVNERVTLTATVENVSDEADIVGRTPYGARPNKRRTTTLGLRYSF